MTLRRKLLNFTLLALCALIPAAAKASVAITPTLVVIEGRQRYADVSIINTSPTTNEYQMGWKFLRMVENTGDYAESPASATDFDLTQHIVFSPRRITLAPNSAQKIRFALRLNGDAPPPGDYRAHFFLREIPRPAAPPAENDARTSVSVNIKIGFTIPVIYRVGVSDATAKIGKVKVARNPKNKKIEVTVPVTKNKSPFGVLGNLVVYHDATGRHDLVGQISNANIFPEVEKRTFTVVLNTDALQSGSLNVIYSDVTDPKKIFDQTVVPIGK